MLQRASGATPAKDYGPVNNDQQIITVFVMWILTSFGIALLGISYHEE